MIDTTIMSYLDIDPNKRHILSLSGGKDSTALAVYLKDKIPDLEYVFCDTGEELRETYAYLDKIEEKLQIKIKRLGDGKNFDDWLKYHKGYLPSARARWCTVKMKIQPYERYVGNDQAVAIWVSGLMNAIGADISQRKVTSRLFTHSKKTCLLYTSPSPRD